MRNFIFFLVLSFSCSAAYSQLAVEEGKGFVAGGDIFGTRNFIENKGQFQNPTDEEDAVLFMYDHGGEKIYFTKKGVIYHIDDLSAKRHPLRQ